MREAVSFDVLASPPKQPSVGFFGADAPCLKALEESELLAEIRKNAKPMSLLLDKTAAGQAEFDYCELFCRLKKLFRRIVKVYPPTFTCDLATRIDALTCPDEANVQAGRTDMRDAYCELLNLIFTFAVECVPGKHWRCRARIRAIRAACYSAQCMSRTVC